MAQSWTEFLSGLLQASSKVDKAAVMNSRGQPIAASEDLQISDKDGQAILCCLKDPARTMTRIVLDDTDFRCFQGNGNALVGMGTNKAKRVLVAKVTDEGAIVLVIGNATQHGSFLFEVQQSLMERARRLSAPSRQSAGAGEATQQAVQPRKMISPPPSIASQEQVLVQLHD